MAARRRTARRKSYRRNAYTAPLAGLLNPRRRKRRSARRRNPVAAVARRKSYRRNPVARRKSYRRNPPDVLGFNIKDIAYAGAAVILAPFVEKQVMSFLPASMTGTTGGRWAVKIGSAALIGFGAKRFMGRQAGNLALVALGANIIADAVAEFMPALTLNYYPPTLNQYSNDGVFSRPAIGNGGGVYTGVYPSMTDAVNSDAYAPMF